MSGLKILLYCVTRPEPAFPAFPLGSSIVHSSSIPSLQKNHAPRTPRPALVIPGVSQFVSSFLIPSVSIAPVPIILYLRQSPILLRTHSSCSSFAPTMVPPAADNSAGVRSPVSATVCEPADLWMRCRLRGLHCCKSFKEESFVFDPSPTVLRRHSFGTSFAMTVSGSTGVGIGVKRPVPPPRATARSRSAPELGGLRLCRASKIPSLPSGPNSVACVI